MKHIKIFSALLLAIFFASCHAPTETTLNTGGGTAGMWTIPDVGTTYIYETTPDPEFDTDVIVKTGQHLGGKTNVVTYVDRFAGGEIDSEYYNIETNGDFSIGERDGLDSVGNPAFLWQTYPTGSRQTILLEPTIDTVLQDGEVEVQSDVRTFVGVENLTLAAGTFSTLHVRQTFTDIDSLPQDPGDSFSEIENYDLWFAPSIGGIYIQTTDAVTENGAQDEESGNSLVTYIQR